MDLKHVENFGAIDADADALLRDCFQDHPAYVAARDRERFLVLGRKGSGKTAIFKKLITERTSDTFSFGHTFDDYPWEHHDLQAQMGVPEERRYIHSWRYLILLGLAKLLLNQDQTQPWDEASFRSIQALEDFVVDSYGSRDPDVRQLFSPERVLRLRGSLKIPFLELSGERLRVKELPGHIQEVNRVMQNHVLAALNPANSYFVCFDQLDLGFTTTDPAYAQRLTGLIIAARDLFVASRHQGKQLNPVVFLRDDIYEQLQFEDKNKVTENFTTNVVWAQDGGELTLRRLMESRFRIAIGTEAAVGWEEIFDESREMPGRQTKYQHICNRTFLRPRDMIKFCNEVLMSFKRDSGLAIKFENSAVHAARDRYSDYLLAELDDEIAKHVPKYREYLEVLKQIGSIQFSLAEFTATWADASDLSGIEASDGLRDLFEFSVVGYLKPGGRGGGSEYVWRYRDPRARFNDASETYRVHAGFKEALDLSRGSS